MEVMIMANLNLSNFIVDRVISGVGYRSDESVLFKMDQCQNTSITCGSEATDIVDNVGSPILTLYRSKTCEISGENAILDFNLTAIQMGADKTVATENATVVAPAQEIFEVPATEDGVAATYDLKNTPKTTPTFLYALNKDSSLGKKYVVSTKADDIEGEDGTFTITDKTITLPTGIEAGTQMFISYDYDASNAVEIVNSAKNFPKSCKLVLRVLGYNPCDKDNKLGAYIIFPSFEMSPDFDLSLNAGEAQSWSGKASQDYCSKDKALMKIVVVDEEDETF
jgi:hypothetical protein